MIRAFDRGAGSRQMFQRAVCFLAPISLALPIDVGSRVFAAEILLPILAAFVFLKSKRWEGQRQLTVIVQLGLVYLFAQISSDIWNGSSYEQYSRGWARIFLFIVNLLSIYIIVGNRRSNLILFALGFAAGRIWITFSVMEGDAIPWKIGFAKPVALIFIVTCLVFPLIHNRNKILLPIMLLILGMYDIVMDFRSHGFVLVGVASLLVASIFLHQRFKRRHIVGRHPIIGVAAAGLLAASLAFQFYMYAAKSGWLSEAATNKFETQVEQTDAPILLAGRSEILVYFEVIFNSIILGHGSWPEDKYYADKLAAERYELGLSNSPIQTRDNAIPLHSHFFGSWIEAGIFGGLFWAYILLLISKSLIRSTVGRSHMRPLYFYAALLLFWDVFFSPFSGFRRLETAFLVVAVLRSLLQRQPFARGKFRRVRRVKSTGHRRQRRGKRGRETVQVDGETEAYPA